MPPKKILIFRTDRMGDVLLNLPLINCLKEHYAPCHLTIVAKRELSGLLSLNTDIDDIIPFDEDMEGRSAFSNIAFASGLKKRRFDLAVVSNPSKALHIISFLAGIPRRVGYRRKWDFLLTDTIEDKKSEGSKHEVEYNLDLARALGIEPKEARFSLSPLEEDTKEVERILHGYGIKDPGRLILLHPHSSNPVKIWPRERFAALSDKICEEAGFTVGVIGGEGEAALTDDLIMAMRHKALNLCGRFSLRQLPALFKKARLLVSNDSGPNHVAAAVGMPVVALFGGRDTGTAPGRWAPYGNGHRVIWKDRLDSITVDEAFEAAIVLR